jgi:hypothetical protein
MTDQADELTTCPRKPVSSSGERNGLGELHGDDPPDTVARPRVFGAPRNDSTKPRVGRSCVSRSPNLSDMTHHIEVLPTQSPTLKGWGGNHQLTFSRDLRGAPQGPERLIDAREVLVTVAEFDRPLQALE